VTTDRILSVKRIIDLHILTPPRCKWFHYLSWQRRAIHTRLRRFNPAIASQCPGSRDTVESCQMDQRRLTTGFSSECSRYRHHLVLTGFLPRLLRSALEPLEPDRTHGALQTRRRCPAKAVSGAAGKSFILQRPSVPSSNTKIVKHPNLQAVDCKQKHQYD